MGFAEFDLSSVLSGSPLQIMALQWTPACDVTTAKYLYNIEIWHIANVEEHTEAAWYLFS